MEGLGMLGGIALVMLMVWLWLFPPNQYESRRKASKAEGQDKGDNVADAYYEEDDGPDQVTLVHGE